MTRADLARVAALAAELGYPALAEDFAARFARLAADPAREGLLVAESPADAPGAAPRVLGWIHVQRRETFESEAHAEICGLIVDPAARRSGAGRALVAAAEAWALERGLARVRVRSNVVRAESHAFYPALGYARAKTQHVYEKRLGG